MKAFVVFSFPPKANFLFLCICKSSMHHCSQFSVSSKLFVNAAIYLAFQPRRIFFHFSVNHTALIAETFACLYTINIAIIGQMFLYHKYCDCRPIYCFLCVLSALSFSKRINLLSDRISADVCRCCSSTC